MSLQRPARRRGFTLAELVMTIVIMGILSAVTAPRFVSWKGFSSRGFYDEAQAVVRYAQKTAVAWRRTIYVCVSATAISATSNSDCTTAPVTHPITGAPLKTQQPPPGVTLSSSAGPGFSSAALGRPTPNAAVTIPLTCTITAAPARQLVAGSQTGH